MEADINSGNCRDLRYSGAKLDHLTWERGRSGDSQHRCFYPAAGTSVALTDTLILGGLCP